MLYLVSLYYMLRIIYIEIAIHEIEIESKISTNLFCIIIREFEDLFETVYVKLYVKFLPRTMCIHSKRSLNNFDIGNWIQRYITNGVNTSAL